MKLSIDAHFDAELRRMQSDIDAKASLEVREQQHIEAFNAVLKHADPSLPVPGTEMAVWKFGHRSGVREMTVAELFVDAMENPKASDEMIRALILCANKGDVDANAAINPVRSNYAREMISKESLP